jgi:3-hydroxyisobutyrate dehydrogenase-like beta-hydroxyacid dehydrogenase
MALRLAQEGYQVIVWARRPDALEPFRSAGLSCVQSLKELARRCPVIGVCVTGDDDVRQIVSGDNGLVAHMRRGGTILIHSTVHPECVAGLEREAVSRGLALLEAPVSGGSRRARAGTLLILVAGHREAFNQVGAVLETLGDPVLYTGALGSAMSVKVLNNVLFMAHLALAGEAFQMGTKLGLDLEMIRQALEMGSGRSHAVTVCGPPGLELSMLPAGAPQLLRKDLALAEDMLTSGRKEFAVLRAAEGLLRDEHGAREGSDHTSVVP